MSRLVGHRLDVVAIGVKHKAGVVVRRIVRTRAWRAIVRGARFERRAVERVDLRLALHPEGDMQTSERRLLARTLDLEQAAIADIEGPEDAVLAEEEAIPQRRKGFFVEELALLEVGHFDGDVVDQTFKLP